MKWIDVTTDDRVAIASLVRTVVANFRKLVIADVARACNSRRDHLLADAGAELVKRGLSGNDLQLAREEIAPDFVLTPLNLTEVNFSAQPLFPDAPDCPMAMRNATLLIFNDAIDADAMVIRKIWHRENLMSVRHCLAHELVHACGDGPPSRADGYRTNHVGAEVILELLSE